MAATIRPAGSVTFDPVPRIKGQGTWQWNRSESHEHDQFYGIDELGVRPTPLAPRGGRDWRWFRSCYRASRGERASLFGFKNQIILILAGKTKLAHPSGKYVLGTVRSAVSPRGGALITLFINKPDRHECIASVTSGPFCETRWFVGAVATAHRHRSSRSPDPSAASR
jgi:hypothetical protein